MAKVMSDTDIKELLDEISGLELKDAECKAKALLEGKIVSLNDGVYFILHKENKGRFTLQIQQIIKGLDKASLRTIHTEKFETLSIESLSLFIRNTEETLYSNYLSLMFEFENNHKAGVFK